MSKFDDLPLHDGVIRYIDLSWSDFKIDILLSAFLRSGQNAKPCKLSFYGVANFEAPHKSPWGESASISNAREVAGGFEVEMQSGDVLLIEAEGFDFIGARSLVSASRQLTSNGNVRQI
ncbi:hypothetical protein BCF53_12247 [Reinekea marinisedimentorum]|uniref:Immunity protein 50 of polymorphic toxin system n=1 Tax=Reinekea marinisedimentorum TaxID=230495 RepID=A0A4R3HW24_9GAMM|nr:hypothetical protein BCF53_12247 [Reinekea marinisedimentorum]